MTSATRSKEIREPCHGLRQIVRFNAPLYALALGSIGGALLVAEFRGPGRVQTALYAAAGVASFWTVGSIAASWIVYDRSSLMTGAWMLPLLPPGGRAWIAIHAGVDEFSAPLRRLLPGWRGRTLDIFDPAEMTEPSISRARRSAAPEAADGAVRFAALPVTSNSVDAVLLLLAAHELRREPARAALLREISRILTPGGRVIVCEHLRDVANFIAFGPGVLHFHSRAAWLRSFAHGGFTVRLETSMTPLVRVFVLERWS